MPLIAIEGIDGTGKSSQQKELASWLRSFSTGKPVVCSAEPTQSELGKRARAASKGEISLTREQELDAFLEDRQDHVNTLITPNLAAGNFVILDRYYASTMAYQSRDGHWVVDALRYRNEGIAPIPDLWIILDLPPVISLQRIQSRLKPGEEFSAFERLETLTHCREVFLSMAGEDNVVVISTIHTPEVVAERVRDAVRRHILR